MTKLEEIRDVLESIFLDNTYQHKKHCGVIPETPCYCATDEALEAIDRIVRECLPDKKEDSYLSIYFRNGYNQCRIKFLKRWEG